MPTQQAPVGGVPQSPSAVQVSHMTQSPVGRQIEGISENRFHPAPQPNAPQFTMFSQFCVGC